MKELLFKLCSLSGVSGDEGIVARFCAEYLEKYTEVSVDAFNNVTAVMGNPDADKTILLDAHLDRIGFIVTEITSDGFLRVDKIGGVDLRTALDSAVIVHGKKNVLGIVCCMPPHLSNGKEDKTPEISDIYIDVALDYEEVKSLISVGDSVSFYSKPVELLNGKIASAALDNRAGVCALLKTAENISKLELNHRIVIALTSQEETYAVGAKTSAFKYSPDECICVDVSFASQPGINDQYAEIKLGKGPMLCVSPNLSREMFERFTELCANNDINYQLEICNGRTGTNADHIVVSGEGVKSAVISIPEKNMHTQGEIIDISDVEKTAELITLYITGGKEYE